MTVLLISTTFILLWKYMYIYIYIVFRHPYVTQSSLVSQLRITHILKQASSRLSMTQCQQPAFTNGQGDRFSPSLWACSIPPCHHGLNRHFSSSLLRGGHFVSPSPTPPINLLYEICCMAWVLQYSLAPYLQDTSAAKPFQVFFKIY